MVTAVAPGESRPRDGQVHAVSDDRKTRCRDAGRGERASATRATRGTTCATAGHAAAPAPTRSACHATNPGRARCASNPGRARCAAAPRARCARTSCRAGDATGARGAGARGATRAAPPPSSRPRRQRRRASIAARAGCGAACTGCTASRTARARGTAAPSRARNRTTRAAAGVRDAFDTATTVNQESDHNHRRARKRVSDHLFVAAQNNLAGQATARSTVAAKRLRSRVDVGRFAVRIDGHLDIDAETPRRQQQVRRQIRLHDDVIRSIRRWIGKSSATTSTPAKERRRRSSASLAATNAFASSICRAIVPLFNITIALNPDRARRGPSGLVVNRSSPL